MPERKKTNTVFAGCALAVFGGWVTLIIGVIAMSQGETLSDSQTISTSQNTKLYTVAETEQALQEFRDVRATVDGPDHGTRARFQLVAAGTDRDDIGSAASRRFDSLYRDGQLNGASVKQRYQVTQQGGGVLEPAWNWLEDANRSYHGEIVPRIKRGGGSSSIGVRDDVTKPNVSKAAQRRGNDGNGSGSTFGSWVPFGIGDWLSAAQRGYSTEIVPRLSGKVPSVIVARRPDEDDDRETEAERRRRLERERAATQAAERERLEAERRRREEELREIAEREQAAREAARRKREEEEEARKIAEERRRVLERRAEQQRLAAAAKRKREEQQQEQLESERRRAREAELARAQDAAEKAALERQRRADQEKQLRDANEARRRRAEEFQRERQRLAKLRLQEREDAKRRQLLQQRRDRLKAQAEAIKRRNAEAALRAQEKEQQRRARDLEERRRAAERERQQRNREFEEKRRAAERQRERRRLEEQRRQRQALAAERAKRAREAVPPPTQRPRRFAQNNLRDLNRFRVRDTEIEFRSDTRKRRQTKPTGLQGLNRFKVRDTEIEISSSRRTTSRTTVASRQIEPQRRKVKSAQESHVARVDRPKSGKTKVGKYKPRKPRARRRASKVRSYRRRAARTSNGRCHPRAGRRITPPGTYVVRKGDSLWTISKRHYRLGQYFKIIVRANARKIRKARLIYPCQRLHLPRRT